MAEAASLIPTPSNLITFSFVVFAGKFASANINFSQINFLPGVIDLANEGIIPGGTKRNLDYAEKFAHFSGSLSPTQKLLACDAQTSGGLLISLPETEANRFISIYGEQAVKIGNVAKQNNYVVSINS